MTTIFGDEIEPLRRKSVLLEEVLETLEVAEDPQASKGLREEEQNYILE